MMSVAPLPNHASSDVYLSDESSRLTAPLRRLSMLGRERGAPTSLTEPEFALASSKSAGRFYRLAEWWKTDTRYLSSLDDMVLHPAYLHIIGMGTEALPFLFQELKRQPDHWFWALHAITGEDPVPSQEKGNLEAMTRRWLRWGVENGWIRNEG